MLEIIMLNKIKLLGHMCHLVTMTEKFTVFRQTGSHYNSVIFDVLMGLCG